MIDEFVKWLDENIDINRKGRFGTESRGKYVAFCESKAMYQYLTQWEPKVGEFAACNGKNSYHESGDLVYIFSYIPKEGRFIYLKQVGEFFSMIKRDFLHCFTKTDKTFPLDGIIELAELPRIECRHNTTTPIPRTYEDVPTIKCYHCKKTRAFSVEGKWIWI